MYQGVLLFFGQSKKKNVKSTLTKYALSSLLRICHAFLYNLIIMMGGYLYLVRVQLNMLDWLLNNKSLLLLFHSVPEQTWSYS